MPKKSPLNLINLAFLLLALSQLGFLIIANRQLDSALAQNNSSPTLNVEIPGFSMSDDPDATQYIAAVYKYLIGFAGVLAAAVIIYGGILWLSSGGNSSRASEGQEWIKSSLLGLTLVLTTFLILNTINTKLVNLDKIDPDQVEAVPLEIDPLLAEDINESNENGSGNSSAGVSSNNQPPTVSQMKNYLEKNEGIPRSKLDTGFTDNEIKDLYDKSMNQAKKFTEKPGYTANGNLYDPYVQPITREAGENFLKAFPEANITSTFRDPVYNKSVNGSPTSRHPVGLALDITGKNLKAYQEWFIANYPGVKTKIHDAGTGNHLHVEFGSKEDFNRLYKTLYGVDPPN